MIRCWVVIGLSMLAFASHAAAERTWRDQKGNVLQATFVGLDGDTAILENKGGKKFKVKVNSLSPADQEWIRNNPRTPAENELPALLKRGAKNGEVRDQLTRELFATPDEAQKQALQQKLDALMAEKEDLEMEATDLFLKVMPTEALPFSRYQQRCKFGGALTWTLFEKDTPQLGYVSLVYREDAQKVAALKASKPVERIAGFEANRLADGAWIYLSDHCYLQVTFHHEKLKNAQAFEQFLSSADLKGLGRMKW